MMVLTVLAVLAALAAAFGAEPTCSAEAPDGVFSLAMGREVISGRSILQLCFKTIPNEKEQPAGKWLYGPAVARYVQRIRAEFDTALAGCAIR